MLLGLAGVAITQPVLDLFGRNPEFFIAGSYTRAQIVEFALLVALAPALCVLGIALVAALVNRRIGVVTALAGVAAFAVLFGLALARTLGLDSTLTAGALALAVAAATLLLELRTKAGRLLLRYLAGGNALFLLFFLVASPTADLVRGADVGELGHVDIPRLEGPVVVIVFDELPMPTLMTPDGRINEQRFPSFARLARETTWFRNASSHHPLTNFGVPNIVTGVRAEKGQHPTYHHHPKNLLTLFGNEYPLYRYERITEMCPPSMCEPKPAQPLSQALEDSSIVYRHRVLPKEFRDDLPSIDTSWGRFGDTVGAGDDGAVVTTTTIRRGKDESTAPEDDRYAIYRSKQMQRVYQGRQAASLVASGTRVTAEPAVHLVHVEFPHQRWTISPWFHPNESIPERVKDPSDPAYEFSARVQYVMHTMQVGAADRALGDVLDHMRDVGAWDDATVVVTADHGISMLPPDFGRVPTDRNHEELFRVPLFIKAPGQRAAEIVDTPAATLDVLPSIIDLLDIETDWTFEGHSLFDGSTRTVEPLVSDDVNAGFAIAAQHASLHTGLDWAGLAGFGEHKALVGRRVDELSLGRTSSLRWTLDERALMANLPTERGKMPYALTGTVQTRDGSRPPELVVAVNGRIAGVIGGYQKRDGAWQLSAILTDAYRKGRNDVVAYEVVGAGGSATLREVPFA